MILALKWKKMVRKYLRKLANTFSLKSIGKIVKGVKLQCGDNQILVL